LPLSIESETLANNFRKLIIFGLQPQKMPEYLTERITIDPQVCHGKPVIRGMRYPVESMLELLASGMSIDELLADYPDLEREDLLACIEYAARLTQVKSIYRIAS
jgi:uncharacterized protein (DUF433 family)